MAGHGVDCVCEACCQSRRDSWTASAALTAERQAGKDEGAKAALEGACERVEVAWMAAHIEDKRLKLPDILAAVKGECGDPPGVCYCGGCVM